MCSHEASASKANFRITYRGENGTLCYYFIAAENMISAVTHFQLRTSVSQERVVMVEIQEGRRWKRTL